MRCLVALASAIFTFLPGAAAAAEEPEAVYGKFHAAILAGRLAEVERYATSAQKASLAAAPAAQKQAQIEFMGKLLPRSFSFIGRTPGASPDQLTLYVSGEGLSLFGGKPETTYGTVSMAREAGEWKVGETSWNNQKPRIAAAAPSAAPLSPTASPAPSPAPASPAKAAATKPRARTVAATPQAPAPAPRKAADPCVFKPVMTDEDLRKCR